MDSVFKFRTIHQPSDGNYFQRNGASIVLPDQSEVYGHRSYLNKIFRESGYKGVRTVGDIYDVVGDPDGKLDSVKFGGVLVSDGADNFIYMRSSRAYDNFIKVLDFIESLGARVVEGDKSDFTHFAMVVNNNNVEYIFEFSIKDEWITVFRSYDKDTGRIYPMFMMRSELDTEDDILQWTTELLNPHEKVHLYLSDIPRYDDELNVMDLRWILECSGLIKRSKKAFKLNKGSLSDDLNNQLMNYLEVINSTPVRASYSKLVNTEELFNFLVDMYLYKTDPYDESASDSPFRICSYLWNHAHWVNE